MGRAAIDPHSQGDDRDQPATPASTDERLAEDRARLRLALETANLLTWEIDPNRNTLSVSHNAPRALGISLPTNVSEVIAMIHPDDRQAVIEGYRAAIRGDSRFEAELRLARDDGAGYIWIQAQGIRVDSNDGRKPTLVGVSQNINDRKQRELNAAFLVTLSDAIRPLTDTTEIQREVTHLLGRQLGASRVILAEVTENGVAVLGPQYTDGVPPLPGTFDTSTVDPDVLAALTTRTTVVRDDTFDAEMGSEHRQALEALALRAHVDVPLVRNGQLVGALSVHQSEPRQWTPHEVAIVEETAERAWSTIERIRAEQQLGESDRRYRTLFETIDEGFCVIELIFDDADTPVDYRFIEANPAFERLTGWQDVVGRRIKDIVPGLESAWFEVFGKVAMTGEPVRMVNQTPALQGRWLDVHAFRVGNADPRQVAVLFTDVTEAKRADDALRTFETRLRRAIEIETVGVIFFRPDGPVTYANEAFLRMSGYTRGDIEAGAVRWDTMTPPEWMDVSTRAIDAAFTLGQSTPYEKQYVRKNGSRWWALSYASRIDDNEGVKFIVDITKAKQAEAERERLAAIVENSRDAMIGLDMDGTITDWNPAAQQLYGYTAREAVGRHIDLLIPEELTDERNGVLERLKRQENLPPTETVRRRKDGSLVEVEIRPSPVLDTSGKVIGAAVIARDATERKRLERAQEDFLAMASHDLRSPVTVLSGRAQLMKRRKQYDEAGVEVILEQARRIERLVADLQELVKLESGKLDLDYASVELQDLALQAAERGRLQTSQHEIVVTGPEEPLVGRWDRDRLGQVLDNLIGNAIKYTPDGGKVAVHVEQVDGEARLSVTDEGPGIAPENMPHLFDRFYRGAKRSSSSGLGLGLYISRMLVEAHNGRIWVATEAGKGSTFTIALPLEGNGSEDA